MSRMKNLTLEHIASACAGTYVGAEELKDKEICGAVIDSRQVEEDFLYIPIRGERVDGHDFIPRVFEKGALCVLSEEELSSPAGPYILVESTQLALKQIAAFYRSTLAIPVVGITGSVGKTSTKEMVAAVLAQKYHVHKTAGNFNNEIGLPLTVLGIRAEHEAAVIEMGISDFGEMHRLAEIARPDVCVITNIGLSHLDNLGTRDGILKAKTECFEHMNPQGTVVLNGDDDKLITIPEVHGKRPVFYGDKTTNDIFATDTENLGFEGMQTKIHTPEGDFEVRIHIPGEHNVSNALAATAVGLALGLSIGEIRQGIEAARTISGRTNLIKVRGMSVVDDCYNANPVSMEAALDVLSYAKGRRIAVLGDMGGLGDGAAALHMGVGKYAAGKPIHTFFFAGELAKEYERGLRENLVGDTKPEIYYFSTRDEMIEALKAYVQPEDSILIKASHFMEFPKVVSELTKEEF